MVTTNRRVPLSQLAHPRRQNTDLDRERKIVNSIHIPNCFIPVGIFDFNVELPYLRQTDPRCPLKDCNIIQPKCTRCRGSIKRRSKYIF